MAISVYDIQAEADALGCMITDSASLIEGIKTLTVEEFSQSVTKHIFTTIKDMFTEGISVDETTVSSRVSEQYRDHIRDIVNGIPETPSFTDYVSILADRRTRRDIRNTVAEVMDSISTEVDVTNSLRVLEQHSFALRDRISGRTRKNRFSSEELSEWFNEYLDDDYDDDGEYCFSHAMPSLQTRLGMFARGEFGVVAGYSSDGKSIYGLQMAEQALQSGFKLGYYSLEMPERQIIRRLAAMCGVPLKTIKDRAWNAEQARMLRERAVVMRDWDLDVISGTVTVDQIRADQMRHNYDMIIIDHLHRMPDSEDRIQLERYVRSCKSLALDANCAVIALAQLSRREGFPEPTTNQLRGTDVLTQEPDWCVFVWRERDEFQRRQKGGKMIIGKARDGEADTSFEMYLDTDSMRFREADDLTIVNLDRDSILGVQHELRV